MLEILIGLVALTAILGTLWGIGRIVNANYGHYKTSIWENIWDGFWAIIVAAIILGIVYVVGYILYRFGSVLLTFVI